MTSARYARQRAASRASSRMYRCIRHISQAMQRYIRRGGARATISKLDVYETNADSAVGDGRLVQAAVAYLTALLVVAAAVSCVGCVGLFSFHGGLRGERRSCLSRRRGGGGCIANEHRGGSTGAPLCRLPLREAAECRQGAVGRRAQSLRRRILRLTSSLDRTGTLQTAAQAATAEHLAASGPQLRFFGAVPARDTAGTAPAISGHPEDPLSVRQKWAAARGAVCSRAARPHGPP
ncbi:hypothetical protein LSCM4_04336 [Leishmania orientalis]|uniref:Uncharacterized protein n=1 Tax=Leishmania orientalis TaxID=2249476 RepID=A0A836HDG8_9TRYP|nr:hypothetical protein LSCM4_04336 [Leishmania orientalis]